MKIKKIQFPSVDDILCKEPNQTPICVYFGDYEICIYIQRERNEKIIDFHMSLYRNDRYVLSGVETAVRSTVNPSDYNPLVRQWYKDACEEMQDIIERDIMLRYLEEEDD